MAACFGGPQIAFDPEKTKCIEGGATYGFSVKTKYVPSNLFAPLFTL